MSGSDALALPITSHGHLHLTAALPPQPRRRPRGRGGRVPTYVDHGAHARELREDAIRIVQTHRIRSPVLGVNPDLVLVLVLDHRLDPAELVKADLNLLDITGDEAMVAFAADTELSEFRRRLEVYGRGPRVVDGIERPATDEVLFDAIVRTRLLDVDDVLSLALRDRLGASVGSLRLDVQCWCPEDEAAAIRVRDDFSRGVANAGGRVIAVDFRPWVGLSLLRVEVAADAVPDLARTRRARSIDLLPQPVLTQPQVLHTTPADLPPVLAPAANAPLVAVIDSGVASAHPLIGPAVRELSAIGIGDVADEAGHGTFVASLALYGSLEPLLRTSAAVRAAGWLHSIRVLDGDTGFPDEMLWETTLLAAIEQAADAGARVVNLSLGDRRQPYRPPRPTVLV